MSLTGYLSGWLTVRQVSRLMDVVLRNLVGAECWIFLDDLIFSRSAEEHVLILENILQRLDEANVS